MDEARRRRRRIHLGLGLAESICTAGSVVEVFRAIDGNLLSWVYVILWPTFAGYGLYVWRQLLRQESGHVKGPSAPSDAEDRKLAEWNAYLQRLHDSEGGTKSP